MRDPQRIDKIKEICKNPNPLQILFASLCEKKTCIWCNKNIAIIKPKPYENRPMLSLDWFTPEFLVHAQTTHGYSPDILDIFLLETYNSNL